MIPLQLVHAESHSGSVVMNTTPIMTLVCTAQGLPLWLCAGTGEASVEPPAEGAPCHGGFVCDEPVSCSAAVAALCAVAGRIGQIGNFCMDLGVRHILC